MRRGGGPSRRAWAVFLALLIGLGLPVVAASSAAAATTWTVTNVNDSGPGSLRQAITNADNGSGGDTIAFDIAGTGPFIISPASDLPILNVPVTIDGYTQPGSSPATATAPATIEIQIDGGGTLDIGLGFRATGGLTTVEGLSVTNFGAAIFLNSGDGYRVIGNDIGVDAAGTMALPDGFGVIVEHGSTATVEGNTITDSTSSAVVVGDTPTDVNTATVRQNSIFANPIGIDLGHDGATPNHGTSAETGPNSLQNYPTLTAVTPGGSTTISGTLTSTPNSTFTVDLYANASLDGFGLAEGQTWLGSTPVTTDGSGVASFTATGLRASTTGELFTATATNAAGGTSEFSVSPPVAVADTATTLENAAVDVAVRANDTDADTPPADVTVASVASEVGGTATIDAGKQGVTFTPTTGFTGTASFTYTDVDQTGAVSNSATVTIAVNAVNTAPTLQAIPNQSVAAGSPLSFTAVGADTNTPPQTLTYSLVGAPAGAAIDASSGVVTWTPTVAQIGTAMFTVQVTNTSNLSATTPVTVNVTADSTTTMVTSSNLDATYGQSVTFTATVASGDDGGTVGFFADNSATPLPGCATVALGGPGGDQATCTTSTLAASTHTITAVYTGDAVTDGSQNTLTGQVVNQASVTVTASAGTMTYGGTVPTITASYSGFVNGQDSSVLTAAPICTANASVTTLAGTYLHQTSCSGAAATNYTFTYVNGTLTVNQASVTVTASAGTMTYGGTVPTITASYSGFVNGQDSSVLTAAPICTANASVTTLAGTYLHQTSCSGAAATNYTFTYVNGTLTVNQASVTVTASAGTMTYGGTVPTITASYSGFVNGQDSSVLTAAPICTANASVTTLAGTYLHQTSCSGAAATNYTFTYVNGTLTVNQASVTVTASAGTMTYGGTVPTITASYSGFVNGQDSSVLTAAPICTANASVTTLAGTYLHQTSCSGAAATNYTFTYVNGTLTVNQASVTVTASAGTMTYGGTVPTITASYSGFVNGQDSSVLTAAPICTANASVTTLAGTYLHQTSCSGAAATNYTFTYVNGTLTVNQASVTVTASAGTMTYGGTVPTITASYSGFVNGQDSSVLTAAPICTANASVTTLAGTYLHQTSCSGAAATNYTFTYVNGTLTVNQASVTVTASAGTMTYGGTVPTITASYSGFVNGQDSSVLTAAPICTANASVTTLAGTYLHQTSCSGAAATNYTFTYVNGTLTVNQASVTVTASAGMMTYGGTPPTITATITGFVNGETASVLTAQPVCTPNATATTPAATYPNTTSCSGAAAANYTFTYVNGTLTVNPAPLTVTASAGMMTYGGTPPTITATITGFVNGETASVLTAQPVCTPNATATIPAATYPNTTSCSGAAAANYTFTYVNGTLTVNPAPLTVTASAGMMTYGGTPPTITATITGFVNGETASVLTAQPVCTPNATATIPAATYPNTTSCSGAAAANYTFTYVNGTLTVNPAPLIVSADNQTRYFGQPNPTLTYTVNGLVNGDTAAGVLTGTPKITTKAVLKSAPGTYPITITDGSLAPNGNYTITGFTNGTLTVTKAPTGTTVTFKPASPSFGASVTITATVTADPTTKAAKPTGTAAFYLDGSATPIATVTLTETKASITTEALGAGPHTFTVVYSGDGDFLASTSAATPLTVTVTSTVTGSVAKTLIVTKGKTVVVVNGTLSGSVDVEAGGALDLENSTVSGTVTFTKPLSLRVCGATIGGALTVTGAKGLVVIGDPGDAACTPNAITGALTLQNNTGGVEAIGNTIGALVATNNTGPGPFPGDVTTIADNIIE